MKLFHDLHLHSCLSPCAQDDMTPANLAGMCALAGLDVVALTDHNSVGNCAPFLRAAQNYGLLAIPGMELTTAEEIHMICLFPGLEAATAFGQVVYQALPPTPNDKAIFGPQLYMDEADGLLGEEHRLLAGATSIPVSAVAHLVARYGGVAYPAHVDRPSFSLLSQLGLWDPGLGFPLAELSRACPTHFLASRPDLTGVPTLTASDAHALDQVADASSAMDLPRREIRAVLTWLATGGQ